LIGKHDSTPLAFRQSLISTLATQTNAIPSQKSGWIRYVSPLPNLCFRSFPDISNLRGKQKSYNPSPSDVASFTGNQKLVFLETIDNDSNPLSPERARLLAETYALLDSKNVELLTAYYKIALRARDQSSYQGVADLLGSVGRMKFVRPLFRGLNEVDRDLAVETFTKNRDFYHPICRGLVEKDLGLSS
jgi:hypothetical protein